jgi:putative endonuclease
MEKRRALGTAGEDAAARFLTASGYRILDRQWRCLFGELDIVALKGGDIVFIEVKTRHESLYGGGEEAITASKRRHLRLSALAYLSAHGRVSHPYRIDVIVVEVRGNTARLRHYRYAVGECE